MKKTKTETPYSLFPDSLSLPQPFPPLRLSGEREREEKWLIIIPIKLSERESSHQLAD